MPGDALTWLDKALADHSWWMTNLMIEPRFDSLRGDPRFAVLLKAVGFKAIHEGRSGANAR